MRKYYYAVRKGRQIGIFDTWDECNAQVKGYKGAEFKKFSTKEEALDFIGVQRNDVSDDIGEMEIIAYVDGSYNSTTTEFGYGVVLIDHNYEETTFNGSHIDENYSAHRNVAGEIFGSIEAIKKAIELGKSKIYLHYDYMGISEWAEGRWKTNKELTQKYKKFIDEANERIDIRFIKVKAHSNDKYNDMADKLAKDACGIAE